MKQGKRLLTAALALALTLALALAALPAAAEETYPAEIGKLDLTANWKGKTVILHTNDVHGAISGYAVAAHMKLRLEHQGADVLLVDAGDFSQGEMSVNNDDGASAVRLMNAAGYDLAIPGNHEFDYGVQQLETNLAGAEFPVICANIFRGEDGPEMFEPTWTYTGSGGLKLGFFGLDTPESQTKANPALVKGLHFLAGQELLDCAQAQTDALRADGADLVIAMLHLGVNAESEPNRSEDVCRAVRGIDFAIDGHSHTVMTAGENGENVQSTGTKSAYIGVIVIDNKTKTIESHFLAPMENAEQEPAVAALVAEINARITGAYEEVVGEARVTLEGDRAFTRTQETNSGDLLTDALRARILAQPEALRVDADHLIALVNGGGIRETIPAGPITRGLVNTVQPFSNTLCVVYCTGAQLLEALEASTHRTPEQVSGFPQVSGLNFTVDTTKPYDKGESYPNSTFFAPASIRRVNILSVNGQPFSTRDTYAVATCDFVALGGDSYSVFAGLEHFDTGALTDDILVDYIRNELGGVVGEQYAAPQGRCVLITLDNSRCVPSAQRIELDGAEVRPEAYNINGENYVMLRDLAMLLSGTAAQFEVDYDPETDAVSIETGRAYTPVGGELAAGPDRSGTLAVSAQSLTADGAALNLCAYNLAGNNFYRLRDLGAALGFGVDFDPETFTAAIRTAA